MLVDIIRSLKRSIVYIVQGNNTGTGFITDKIGYIATCNHVVKDQTPPSVYVVSNPKELEAQMLRRQPQYDLATLKVEAAKLEPVTFGGYEDVDEGDEVAFSTQKNALGLCEPSPPFRS